MAVNEQTVNDIPELISAVMDLSPDRELWFRGQGCHTRHLLPSLWRKIAGVNGGLDKVEPQQVLEIERRLITRFRQRSIPYWPAGYPQTDWEHLFAMQHFGLPTRLLDWTSSLLVSAYFANDHDPSRCECGGACLPTIWALNPRRLNANNPRLDGLAAGVLATSDELIKPWAPNVDVTQFAPAAVAIYGTHNNERIAAQSGEFTVAGRTMSPLDESLDGTEGVLWKFALNADRSDILRQLELIGVRQVSVYPGLASLARDIAHEEIY